MTRNTKYLSFFYLIILSVCSSRFLSMMPSCRFNGVPQPCAAREMVNTGNYLIPTMNGVAFENHPLHG